MRFHHVMLISLCCGILAIAQEPKTEPEKDVQQTIDRIVENATKAGGKIKEKDLGKDTRTLQQEVLKDIDSLIKKSENPPPPPMKNDMPSPPMKSDMPPPPMKSDMPPPPMKSDMPPPPMKSDMPPPMKQNGGMGKDSTQMPPPKGQSGRGQEQQPPMPRDVGNQDKPNRRPRPSLAKKDPSSPMNSPEPKKGEIGKKDEPNQAKETATAPKDPKTPPMKSSNRPDRFAEMYQDVWGQLPDRMRQEMDLYYREQFMPRYRDLLRQYYLSIAEEKKRKSGDQ